MKNKFIKCKKIRMDEKKLKFLEKKAVDLNMLEQDVLGMLLEFCVIKWKDTKPYITLKQE